MNQHINPLGPLVAMLNRIDAEDRGRFREPQGLSDQARAQEYRAQALVLPAVAALRAAIQAAMPLSDLMREDLQYLDDAIQDNAPTQESWDEAIAEAD